MLVGVLLLLYFHHYAYPTTLPDETLTRVTPINQHTGLERKAASPQNESKKEAVVGQTKEGAEEVLEEFEEQGSGKKKQDQDQDQKEGKWVAPHNAAFRGEETSP